MSKHDDKEKLLNDVKIDEFAILFDNQSIQDGKTSLGNLQKLGYHTGIADNLKTDLKKGISESNTEDINWRKKTYGSNVAILRKPKLLYEFILECLEDKMLQLLLCASLVSLIIGIIEEGLATGWIEGTAIFFAVFIVVSITAFNNYTKEQQFLKLSLENSKKEVQVVRNGGTIKNIDVNDLLVGDILHISIGNILPVDGIMIDGTVEIDESAMNGESVLIKKKPYDGRNDFDKKSNPFCVSGTSVKGGGGKILVLCVGLHSQMGITKSMLNTEDSATPLQEKLEELADKIGDFGFYSAALIMIAILSKEIIIRIYNGRAIFTSTLFDVLLNSFIIGITVIVVAIPEGLPMAVTISLAYSVFKMKTENNLVRRIEAAETMGGVDQICSDKTGTLTEGTMTLVEVFIQETNYILDRFKIKDKEVDSLQSKEIFQRALRMNNDAIIEKKENCSIAKGNMTDMATLNFLINTNAPIESLEKEKRSYCLPFDSQYKFMATISKHEKNSDYTMFIKGAPDVFIDSGMISKYISKDGSEKEFNEESKLIFKKAQDNFANKCYRTILFLTKSINANDLDEFKESKFEVWNDDDKLKDLTIIGMVAISDPVRKVVPECIKRLTQESGITVRMVTGDNIRTAIAISRSVGILTPDEEKKAILSIKINEENGAKLREIEKKIAEKLKEENEIVSNKQTSDILKLKQDETLNLKNEKKKIINALKNIEGGIYAMQGTDFRVLCGGLSEVEDNKDDKDKKNDKAIEKSSEKEQEIKVKPKKYKLNDPSTFKEVTKNLKVISRASPEDKFLLVVGLKEIGSVVAVTGDGTNDAPALKASDVGFSMGIRGTDIAKDASSIILLSESFESIVSAVKYGRNVYDCIRKFLQFQLTTNIVAVFMTLLGSIVLKDSPLNAIQMLWLNLIMDSFGSLALATEDPKDELLTRKPYSRKENVITPIMMYNIVCQGVFQILVLTVILFYGDVLFNVPSDRELSHFEWNNQNGYHFTIFFHIFVLMQVFNSINARKLKKNEINVFTDIMANNLYLIIQGTILVCQILIISFGGRALRVKHLNITQHLMCIFIAALCIPFGMICKKLPISFEVEEVVVSDGYQKIIKHFSFRKSLRGDVKLSDGANISDTRKTLITN